MPNLSTPFDIFLFLLLCFSSAPKKNRDFPSQSSNFQIYIIKKKQKHTHTHSWYIEDNT